jgi:probable phosphoglycerate mutase
VFKLVVNFDGGGRSEGGPGAWGVVVKWKDGGVLEQSSGWHPNLTNNEAEYHGLIAALDAALQYAPLLELTVRGDSRLVIEQVTGKCRCRKKHLIPLYEAAVHRYLQCPPGTILEWVPRAQNKEADALSTAALQRGGRSAESHDM